MTDDMKFRNVKSVFSFQINGSKYIAHATDGPFVVTKVEVVTFEDRSSILCSGPKTSAAGGGSLGRSARFNINGYDKSPPPPDWLMELLNETGGPVRI